MSSTTLTNRNISDTYKGVLHAAGAALPQQGLQRIYDGIGQSTSIMIGKEGAGVSIKGGITTTGSILLSGTTLSNTVTAYPRIQFGRVQSSYGNDNQYLGSDSTDPIYIERVDTAWDMSELRINIGDNGNEDAYMDTFAVGRTPSSTGVFDPLLTLNSSGNMVVQLRSHTTPYVRPAGWSGGVTSFDFYSDGGTLGAGVGGTVLASLNSAGEVIGRSFSSTSSIQYKTNVTPLDNALNIINKLEGVRFDWKDTGQSDIGLIAESVNEVLPEFVMKDKSTGKPQGVDYGKITAVLIEAVKELTKLVIK